MWLSNIFVLKHDFKIPMNPPEFGMNVQAHILLVVVHNFI